MNITKTEIEGVVVIEPTIFTDSRGYFLELFSYKEFSQKVVNTIFVQDNESTPSMVFYAVCISNAPRMHKPNWCMSLKDSFWILQ